jgi:nucleoside-diphosphate-sugar epimerase
MPRQEDQRTSPLAPYAVSKLATEQYALVANRVYGLETVALRYFNVFGEYQDPYGGYAAVIPRFIHKILDGERPTIFGDGSNSRDFTYIDNVVQANLLAAEARGAEGMAMNVAMGECHTLNELVETLNELMGTDLEPVYADPRPGDVVESMADITRARELLRYEPTVDWQTGLRRTISWISESSAAVSAAS